MTGARAHLPSGQSSEVDVGPLLFNRLPVRPPDTFCKVKGVLRLAGGTMTGEVKLWDKVRKLEFVDIEVRVVLGKPLEVMNRPFASNVVRNDDVGNSYIFQHRCNDVICINVARCRVIRDTLMRTSTHVPFSPLQVTNTVLSHEGVSRANASNNT